jgi:hypothetical protein
MKHQVVEPLESKASKIKKVIGTEAEHVCISKLIFLYSYFLFFS